MLNSAAFKFTKNGREKDQIDIKYLLLFALLHCPDVTNLENKCLALYEILNVSVEQNTHISANDKEMLPTWSKICSLATVELFEFV